MRDLIRDASARFGRLASGAVGVAVGFDGGDFFHLGELRPDGFRLSPAPGAT